MAKPTVEVSLENLLIHKPDKGENVFHVFYGMYTFKVHFNEDGLLQWEGPWHVQKKMPDGTFEPIHNALTLSSALNWIEGCQHDGITAGVRDDRRNSE